MTFEKVSKGNPEQLVMDQHFHTAHSIAKFYNNQNKVQVKILSSSEVVLRDKRAKIFCAKRNWDERAERGYMTTIEHAFHDEIDSIQTFAKRNHKAISEYFLLWKFRHEYHLNRIDDEKLNGITSSELTKEQQERLEKNTIGYIKEDGYVPARQMTGLHIQMSIMQLMHEFENVQWGLLQATKGHFLSADSYQNLRLIPISPKFAFVADWQDQFVSYKEVAQINKQSVESAVEFYFGKDLTKCPIV